MDIEEVSILVVDDVNIMRVQVRDLLISAGFKNISLLDDAASAKQHLLKKPCNIVICDWHMPEGTGLDLLMWVRENQKTRFVIFLMLTADQTKESVLAAINAKVDDYMIKPLTSLQIELKVKAALRKKKVI